MKHLQQKVVLGLLSERLLPQRLPKDLPDLAVHEQSLDPLGVLVVALEETELVLEGVAVWHMEEIVEQSPESGQSFAGPVDLGRVRVLVGLDPGGVDDLLGGGDGAERVLETIVGCAREHEIARAELFYVSQALELDGVDHIDLGPVEIDRAAPPDREGLHGGVFTVGVSLLRTLAVHLREVNRDRSSPAMRA